MVHELSLNVEKKDFIRKYLQTFNGIWQLNKPEFRVVEYILNKGLVLEKDTHKQIGEDLSINPSTIKIHLKDLQRRNILVKRDDDLYHINPKLFTGATKIIINFNVV